MNKFIEINRGNVDSKNRWFNICRNANKPYVVITAKGSSATVEWDYITYPEALNRLFSEKESCLVAELKNIVDKYKNKNTKFSISAATVSISKLSIEDAKAAANEIYDLIDKLVSGAIC